MSLSFKEQIAIIILAVALGAIITIVLTNNPNHSHTTSSAQAQTQTGTIIWVRSFEAGCQYGYCGSGYYQQILVRTGGTVLSEVTQCANYLQVGDNITISNGHVISIQVPLSTGGIYSVKVPDSNNGNNNGNCG